MRTITEVRSQRRIFPLWIAAGLVFVAAGCNQTADNTTASGGVEPAPAEVSEPAAPAPAYVRAVHTVRGADPITVTVGDEEIVKSLSFGEASDFIAVQGPKVKIHSTTEHQLKVVDAEGNALGEPLALDLERGEDVTVVIGGAPGKITLTPFEHTNRGPDEGQAKIAVLHADPALPEIGVTVDDDNWAGDIGYGEVTGYEELAPGAHTMKIRYDKSLVGVVDIDREPGAAPPPPFVVKTSNVVTLTQPVDLQAGKVYSVIVYQDANGLPKLRFLEDKFTPALVRTEDVAPSDGVATNSATTDNAAAVEVKLTEFAIEMPDTLPAGPTTFNVSNTGDVEHNFEIEGEGIEKVFEMNLQSGESKTLEVDLKPGTYKIYCPVADHEGKGMEMQLTVTG